MTVMVQFSLVGPFAAEHWLTVVSHNDSHFSQTSAGFMICKFQVLFIQYVESYMCMLNS